MTVESGEVLRSRQVALAFCVKLRVDLSRSRKIPARPLRLGQKVSPNFLSAFPQEGHAIVTNQQPSGQTIFQVVDQEIFIPNLNKQLHKQLNYLQVSEFLECAKTCAHPAIFFFVSLSDCNVPTPAPSNER
jgi:hypothetical protein